MAGDNVREGLRQHRRIQRAAQRQRQRHIVGAAGGDLLLQP